MRTRQARLRWGLLSLCVRTVEGREGSKGGAESTKIEATYQVIRIMISWDSSRSRALFLEMTAGIWVTVISIFSRCLARLESMRKGG